LVPNEAPGENVSHRIAASKSQAPLLLQGHTRVTENAKTT